MTPLSNMSGCCREDHRQQEDYRQQEEERSIKYAELFGLRSIRIVQNSSVYRVPFLVRGYCASFDDYWTKWIDQLGPHFDLRANNIKDGDHLAGILVECYREFKKTVSFADGFV